MICAACKEIPAHASFRKRLERRIDSERNLKKIRTDYLTATEMKEKLKTKEKTIQRQESQLFFKSCQASRLKIRVRDLKENLKEYFARGNLKAVCAHLDKAEKDGKLEEDTFMRNFLETITQNLNRKKQGKRYSDAVKLYYEVLMYLGGPRIVAFVSASLGGPDTHSVYLWRQKNHVEIYCNLKEEDLQRIADVYVPYIKETGKVPVEISEDETAIIGKITYHQATDELIGFCGPDGPGHQCVADFRIFVGDGVAGFNTIVQAFENNKIGTYARALIINPMHKRLPRLPILQHATCNKFDSEFVSQQWADVDVKYERIVEPIIGPNTGHPSDGDSRRRKLHLDRAKTQANKFHPIPHDEGFVLTCSKIDLPDEKYKIKDLPDQDPIHNVKKVINVLLHPSRRITCGRYIIHMNQVDLVRQSFPNDLHNLTESDIIRDDRQNYKSAEKVACKGVLDCIHELADGPHPELKGLWIYLTIVHKYIDIFQSQYHSLAQKVRAASCVINFLCIWRQHILHTPNMQLAIHFITSQSSTDVQLSCHAAISMIAYMRDNFPNIPCQLEHMGTDCVENHWCKNGQWVGNHHNYTMGDLSRNSSHMVRLETIRLNPDAPSYAKPHPKKESIWYKQYNGQPIADMTHYPSEAVMLREWKAGKAEAQDLARQAGMLPDPYCPPPQWFYHPHDGPDGDLDDVNPEDENPDDENPDDHEQDNTPAGKIL